MTNGYFISDQYQFKSGNTLYNGRNILLLYESGILGYASGEEKTIFSITEDKPQRTKKNFNWGTYHINQDTLKTQRIVLNRNFVDDIFVIEADYLILSGTELELIKEDNLTYPEYKWDIEVNHFLFYPCENKIDSTSWLLNMKWFWDEDAYKKRKDK